MQILQYPMFPVPERGIIEWTPGKAHLANDPDDDFSSGIKVCYVKWSLQREN